MSRIAATICIIATLGIGTSFLFSHTKKFDAQEIVQDSSRAEKNYANFCAGCHGEKMDAFVDRRWKHGNTDKDLFKAIKHGYPDEGMPAFEKAFTDKEINELVEFMQKGIENIKRYEFSEPNKSNVYKHESLSIKLDTVLTGVDVPWGMAFLPNDDILVTERGGKLYRVSKSKKAVTIGGVPEVVAEGQGGLMDIILHPNFKKNNVVYLSYSKGKKTDKGVLATTAITRAVLKGNELVDHKEVFEAQPYSRTRHHYGCRLEWSKDGNLFITVGERGNEKENPQDLSRDLGKVHRIKEDGSIPADNPFVNTPGARPSIYSYGHRNPQGMAIHPKTGEIWTNEHGPRGGDEINILKPATNYGWAVTSYGINYNGQVMTKLTTKEGVSDPLLYWIPSIAPSGMAWVTGKRYKEWKNGLLVGSLRFKYLNLCTVENNKVIKQEILLKNIGRLRDVRMAPNGYIYVAVEKPTAAIFRLLPVKG
ncbi:PQQ-dependent sugar dehydrogenase [Aridibaculum aurantiacum]|uniref:PQQ-dependent sugar dehydrogenase n=1 Tax=Aridibaculum aurantiacum TaxID=2810307 RepID=UPI001A962C98|nr:PQQ-dependent sugar dehydrogenase [Aridibaculum aurantiacum]